MTNKIETLTSNTCAYWADGPQWPLTSEVVHVPMQPEDDGRRIPMEISAEAWKEYAAQGHGDQSHQRMIQRGGFGSVELAILLFQRIKRLEGNRPHGHETAASLTPIEQLLVQWWGSEMDNGELFNRAVRLSEPLAKAMMELPERAAQETPVAQSLNFGGHISKMTVRRVDTSYVITWLQDDEPCGSETIGEKLALALIRNSEGISADMSAQKAT